MIDFGGLLATTVPPQHVFEGTYKKQEPDFLQENQLLDKLAAYDMQFKKLEEQYYTFRMVVANKTIEKYSCKLYNIQHTYIHTYLYIH